MLIQLDEGICSALEVLYNYLSFIHSFEKLFVCNFDYVRVLILSVCLLIVYVHYSNYLTLLNYLNKSRGCVVLEKL